MNKNCHIVNFPFYYSLLMAYILVSFVFKQYSGAKCEKGVQKIIPSEDNTSGYLPAIFVCSLIYQGNPVTCHL